MITPRRLQHIGNQLRADRRSALVLLVLARIREVRDHGCDTSSAGCLAGVDHDEEFHEAVIDIAWSCRLENEDCEGSEQANLRAYGDCELISLGDGRRNVPSSSLTLSPTVTLVS